MAAEQTVHTQVVRDGDKPVAIRRKYLRVTVKAGPDKGKSWDSANERILVGTHSSCDVPLTDPTISRQHFEIVLVQRGYLVRDLESTNGVFLENVRGHELTIDRETTLRVGGSKILLKPIDATVDLPISVEPRFGPLLGHSVSMRRVFDTLGRLAPSELSVLITGESGTGKELAAQALHEASARRNGPFVIVDCGAIPEGLIESELFGHLRGAFTGADLKREGAFVAAAGGTVFLDEIGELPLEMQPRLLGALERRRVTPIGSSHSVDVDVRIVAATNRDLRKEVNRGTFREDLFFRLAGAIVTMPPLRERPEDIPLYVDDFFEGELGIDADTLQRLKTRPWPGNIRELRNVLSRAKLIGVDEVAQPAPPTPRATFSAGVDADVPYKVGKQLLIDEFDKRYLEQILKRHAGNYSRAARAAEVDRVHFLRMLDRFGLRVKTHP